MTIKSDRQQRRDYRKAVEPWPAPSQKKEKPELRGEDPQCLTEVLFHCLAGVRSANSPTELLEQVIVAAREKHLELTDTSGSGGVGFEPPVILSFLVLTINSLVRPFLT